MELKRLKRVEEAREYSDKFKKGPMPCMYLGHALGAMRNLNSKSKIFEGVHHK
jgi:hypothetical protein